VNSNEPGSSGDDTAADSTEKTPETAAQQPAEREQLHIVLLKRAVRKKKRHRRLRPLHRPQLLPPLDETNGGVDE